jgi:hypothetical protein
LGGETVKGTVGDNDVAEAAGVLFLLQPGRKIDVTKRAGAERGGHFKGYFTDNNGNFKRELPIGRRRRESEAWRTTRAQDEPETALR